MVLKSRILDSNQEFKYAHCSGDEDRWVIGEHCCSGSHRRGKNSVSEEQKKLSMAKSLADREANDKRRA